MNSAMRIAVLVIGVLAVSSSARGQRLAVYESEANSQEYHGIYQEPLRAWLADRGLGFEVIGDSVAAGAEQLARYDLVLAASVYVVPEACAQGLAQYLNGGGRVIWLDSPARCRDAGFRAALGLGPATAYAPLTEVVFRRVRGAHPAALSAEDVLARRSVGNSVVDSGEGATVLLEMRGTTPQGGPASFPAVILSRPGRGTALVYNWIPATPALDPLLADGLDYMLADVRLQTESLVVAAASVTPTVRQPESIEALGKLYRRAQDPPPELRFTFVLVGPDGEEAASQHLDRATWHTDASGTSAALLEASMPTATLPDGRYTLRFSASGAQPVVHAEATVELTGRRWAELRRAEAERRKLLDPLLRGTLGDYDAEPRTPDGRVDLPRLTEQIDTAHMTMYDFLIWHAPTDWEDFQAFLPLAYERGLKVWVTLCPPSEQGGNYPWSEPYRLDYVKWAEEIGKLAAQYDNLVALVIDDFWSGSNHSLFTPEYIARVVEVLRSQDPDLAFLPTIYWDTVGDEEWIEAYGSLIDGIVFPYCEYVTGDALAEQLAACRRWIGPDEFLLVNVYAAGSGGGDAPPRTADYMRKTLTVSREQSDGIRLYCLPKEKLLDDERYAVTAELYGRWQTQE